MENRFGQSGFTVNFSPSNALRSTVTSAAGYQRTASRRPDSLSDFGLCTVMAQGTKRKRFDYPGDDLQNTSLSLGVGNSSSSCDTSKQSLTTAHTISSAKETDDGSSIYLGLSLQFNPGNDSASSLKNPICNAPNSLEKEPNVELELGLSVGQSESVVTSPDIASFQHFTIFEQSQNIVSATTVDEGSTSSRWKSGNKSLPYLQATEKNMGISPKQIFPGRYNHTSGLVCSPMVVQMQSNLVSDADEGTTSSRWKGGSKLSAFLSAADKSSMFPPNQVFPGNFDVVKNPYQTPAVVQMQKSLVVSVSTVDEGSTSSRWKGGSKILPLLNATENTGIAKQVFPANSDMTQVPDQTPIVVQLQKGPGACTSGVAHPQQRNSSTKTCFFPGCGKGGRGSSGLCIAHGGGRRCQKEGCNKGAEGRTIFCKAHGGGRRCEFLGCTKSAEGSTDFCIAHGGGNRCSHEGCQKAARGKFGLCIRHGGGKRCQMEGCTKSAEGQSGCCIAHGGGRRCQYADCKKGAQGSTNFCKSHGGGKRCTYPGCGKGAEGSTPFCKGHGGGKRCSFQGGCSKSVHGGTQFCVAHGGGKRCAVAGCTKSARGRTNFCVRHGGGKRCKFDGCTKSAQGSTDFCKAHGGGKRCSWGQPGSIFGVGAPPCDRFARGKIGLCASHMSTVEDSHVHGGQTVGAATAEFSAMGISETQLVAQGNAPQNVENSGVNAPNWSGFDEMNVMYPVNTLRPVSFSIPERSVHGGNFLSLVANGVGFRNLSGNQVEGSSSVPRMWL